MIITHGMLLDSLSNYGAPANKIMRMVKSEEITPIIRGLYETDANAPAHALAASIYGPSYLSFEWALAFHGLIPERVEEITSATFNKGRKKTYTTSFGRFTFRDVPSAAFPVGLELRNDGEYWFRIASPEKALCDQLCKIPPAAGTRDLKSIITNGMRIDCEDFAQLDASKIIEWRNVYRKTNITLLCKLLEKGNCEQDD